MTTMLNFDILNIPSYQLSMDYTPVAERVIPTNKKGETSK